MNTTQRILRALMVLGMLAATAIPNVALAHECAAYEGCDAREGCKEDEDHEHTDYNRIDRDESCKSEKEEEEGPGKEPEPKYCYVADKRFPDGVCELVNTASKRFNAEGEEAKRVAGQHHGGNELLLA